MKDNERFFEKAARLDALAVEDDPWLVVGDVVEMLEDGPTRRYFFGRLQRAEWLIPLRERGFFDDPPNPIATEGQTRFPIWPEGGYLARVANLAPETVLDIILRVPDTGNIRVHEDFGEAALAMPPGLAARLVPKARAWLDIPGQIILPDTLRKVMIRLVDGGEIGAALELSRALLALRAEDRTYGGFTSSEPRSRFDVWDYQELVKEAVPRLVEAAEVEALSLLFDVLEDAARISHGAHSLEQSEEAPHGDGFYIERPAIVDHPQNEPHGLVDALIVAVRDAAESLVDEEKISVRSLVETQERRGWRIFDRLALHLLWRFPEAAPDLVAERLTDRGRFDDPSSRHEYALLARRCFETLDPAEKQTILGWIDAGPDLGPLRERRKLSGGQPPTEEEELRYSESWRRDRLALLGDGLPEGWRRRYAGLVDELGEPDHPEFVSYTSPMWVGPTSPTSAEDLSSMDVDRLLRHLRSWEASGDFMSPSYEGLGRELTDVVASEPEHYAEAATQFRGLTPTYVRAFFYGLRDAVRGGKAFAWPSVLDLCRWVLAQPPDETRGYVAEQETRATRHDLDPGWGWTRKSIAGLLSEGLQAGTAARLPSILRGTVWEVLAPLTEDEDPTPAHEERYGGSNMGPSTLSINTTRGEAMHAVMRYAAWVREEAEESGEGVNASLGFDDMPEVRDLLDLRLDPGIEPSAAVRSVYGQWFPYLVWLDRRWAERSVGKIFPTAPEQHLLRAAAWGSFLAFTRPHPDTFGVLGNEYRRAVELLPSSSSEGPSRERPDERLAEHLMILYWWGTLDLGDSGGLLSRFFANADDKLRGHALDFVGISLHRTDDVAADTLSRLRELWERRSLPPHEEPPLCAEEAAAFGWWFASAKFDDSWSVKQLKDAASRANDLEAYDMVMERLAALSSEMPADAAECLRLVLARDAEGWRALSLRHAQRQILRAALRSEDGTARATAEDIINQLGARGQWDLGELLREAKNETTH